MNFYESTRVDLDNLVVYLCRLNQNMLVSLLGKINSLSLIN